MGAISKVPYSLEDAESFLKGVRSLEIAKTAMEVQYKMKNIQELTRHYCRRLDYMSGKKVTFYDSQALFGM